MIKIISLNMKQIKVYSKTIYKARLLCILEKIKSTMMLTLRWYIINEFIFNF